jgi:Mg2+ and Co2+ transporter CorA
MRVFHLTADRFTELPDLPAALPATGWVWVASARREFEVRTSEVQALLATSTGGPLLDLHVADLLNHQLPSQHGFTSWYDLLVFRRLAAGANSAALFVDDHRGTASTARQALDAIDTSPVGFAVLDRVLVTVHPTDCQVRDHFIARLAQTATEPRSESRSGVRLPAGPADLMLRMVNHMVDSYLELRRLLTRQLAYLQHQLLDPRSRFQDWNLVLDSRNALHLLEDTCEDQRSAIQEWTDALEEWPAEADPAAAREREVLRVRSRDVLEHIERVLVHVRRLESSAESAVQLHFSALANRTNDVMRTLTVLTAIFMPLNLVTGFFGMNFESLPLIHEKAGVWMATAFMAVIGVTLGMYFWRKRYLGRSG